MSPANTEVAGVGLIVTHHAQDCVSVLLLTERESKQWLGKYAGMQSFPMETREPGETIEENLQRLLDQELPGMTQLLTIGREPIGYYQIVTGTWLLVFHARSKAKALPHGHVAADVGNHVWVSLKDSIHIRALRQGAFEPLRDLAAGNKSVVCEQCLAPSVDVTSSLAK